MQVDLLYCTPQMLKAVWCAARTCYSPLPPQDLWASEPTEEEMLRLANRIFTSRHLSVAEHCSLTYAVTGVSRTLLAQYSRHRIGVSLSVQSQRYVAADRAVQADSLHLRPPSLEKSPEAQRVYEEYTALALEGYQKLAELGIPKEDARFLLPGGIKTNFITTVNLRSLLDIYEKRVLTPGAQWEIKELLTKMVELLLEREPWLAKYFAGGND
ncbi:MAG: FAD-dependent thymidylate synthase [Limnochordia bacterium]